jgi:all-trans-retinol 13,14-reductase
VIAVVGGGLGGLVSAALLARAGHPVTVFEHHRVLGGLSHTFRRRSWRWDVGVHAVGGLDARPGRMLAELAPGLRWAHSGAIGDRFELPGLRFDWPSDEARLPSELSRALGEDVELAPWTEATTRARRRHLDQLQASVRDRPLRPLVGGTTRALLEGLGLSARAQALLTGRWAYHGLVPQRSSVFAHSMVSRSYAGGSHYPVGGAASLARELRAALETHGGRVELGRRVTGLGLNRSRVRTISMGSESIEVQAVVAGLGAHRLLGLLPERWSRHPWTRALAALPASVQHVGLFLGLSGDPRSAGAGPWNLWLHNTWSPELETWDPRLESRPPACYASFPSLKDPRHQGGHTASLVAFVPPDLFPPRGTPAYSELKRRMERVLLAELLQRLPDLAPMVEHVELGTPATSTRFLASASAYGLAATPERYASPWLRARTPIQGLVLAGGDLVLGSVLGAVAGGELAALALDPALQPIGKS